MKTKNGTLFIIAAPSGAGKTSLIKSLTTEDNNIDVSISYTTRQARADENDGEEYHFINKNEFKELIKRDYFLEYAKVFGNYYGTSKDWVEQKMFTGRNFILEIDWQGALQIKSQLRDSVSIFVLPPSYKTLRTRLISRQKDDLETIEQRMDAACEEISHYRDFDYVVINDDFKSALKEIKAIITTTNLGACRQSSFYDDFISQIVAQKD
jgi:guanylate kinase